MGDITIPASDMHHLLADPARGSGNSYQQAFAGLAVSHRGLPVAEIVPLLRAAADVALLGFTGGDLSEQAQAISTGARYELRVRVTGS
ncbi:hypothetical protein ACFCWY_20005 [Streptomyces sp. NPDC056362]|uniref:hypothetical protein n=1 Tax=unclassified Streptomyces TaxID=2593676 RepID=UPI0035DAEB01